MSFSSRSLLSLARSAIRLLTRPNAAPTRTPGPAAPAPRPPASKFRSPKSAAPKTHVPKKSAATGPPRPASKPAPRSSPASASAAQQGTSPAAAPYPGDYRGKVSPVYAPNPDGQPDPGEVVWAWVPYEDDYSQGKDRPVLLIGRSGSRLLALMMTTRDRNNEREADPDYVDAGTGSWDSRGRPSEVKLDRVVQLDPAAIRRQGAVLSPAAFQRVVQHFMARR